jgi:uncharacterized protein YkwD
MKVKDIMTENPLFVHPETPINEIEKIFNSTKFWSVYVGEQNDFVGIITRDDLRYRRGSYSLSTPAYKIMTKGVISIDENADVEDAQRILSAKRINGIAVTGNGKHVGIVTQSDITTKKNRIIIDVQKTESIVSLPAPPSSPPDKTPIPEENTFDKKEKFRKYAIIMIVFGFLILFLHGIGFFLIGAGVITLITNLDSNRKYQGAIVFLSFIFATFASLANGAGSYSVTWFIEILILSLIILYIIYWLISLLYQKSENWGIVIWILVIMGILILLAVLVAFIFGMIGEFPYNQTSAPQSTNPQVKSSPTPIITSISEPTLQRAIITLIPTEKPQRVQTTTNFGGLSSPSIDTPTLEKRVHELINQQRNSHGLTSLTFDSSLATIARGHSQEMAINNYFSHVNLQGLSPTDRGNQQGYPCRKDYGSYYTFGIAENIFKTHHETTINGISKNDFESLETIAQKTVDSWMNSPGHRENILKSTYDREGIGVGVGSDYTVYVTEDFC